MNSELTKYYIGTIIDTDTGDVRYSIFTHMGEDFGYKIVRTNGVVAEYVEVYHDKFGITSATIDFIHINIEALRMAEKLIQEFKEEFLRCG
jgi:hypothetical protein